MNEDLIEQQRILWNSFSQGWGKWDAFLMHALKPIGEQLMESVQLRKEDVVLDVATGTGEPGLMAAAKTKRVVGIDVSEEMVNIAMEHSKLKGISNYQAQVCSASSLPFKDHAFSVVLCRFGVMFFADPREDMQEILRVLKQGGRIAFSAWAQPEKNPMITVSGRVIQEMLKQTPPDPDAPGIFRYSQRGKLAQLFQQSGLEEVHEEEVIGEIIFSSAEQYWNYTKEIVAPVAIALAKVDSGTQEKIKQAVLERARAWEKGNQIIFPRSAWIVSGVKP